MKFLQSFIELANEARAYIQQQAIERKTIPLFHSLENEEEDWDRDIYGEIPDFPYYDKYGFADWAAVKEIKLTENGGVEIEGLLKGDNYPKTVTITLPELSFEHTIHLAEHLSCLEQGG